MKRSDIVLIIDDARDDVLDGYSWYNFVRSFSIGIINALPIAPYIVRLGVVTYNTAAHVDINLGQYMDAAGLEHAILNLQFQSGGDRNTAAGLNAGRNLLFSSNGGARPGVQKVAFLITNGRSSRNRGLTQWEADLTKSAGVEIFSIGVTNQVDEVELKSIASMPTATHYHFESNYNSVTRLIIMVLQKYCTPVQVTPSSSVVSVTSSTTVYNASRQQDIAFTATGIPTATRATTHQSISATTPVTTTSTNQNTTTSNTNQTTPTTNTTTTQSISSTSATPNTPTIGTSTNQMTPTTTISTTTSSTTTSSTTSTTPTINTSAPQSSSTTSTTLTTPTTSTSTIQTSTTTTSPATSTTSTPTTQNTPTTTTATTSTTMSFSTTQITSATTTTPSASTTVTSTTQSTPASTITQSTSTRSTSTSTSITASPSQSTTDSVTVTTESTVPTTTVIRKYQSIFVASSVKATDV